MKEINKQVFNKVGRIYNIHPESLRYKLKNSFNKNCKNENTNVRSFRRNVSKD
jgi:hypothetical protein